MDRLSTLLEKTAELHRHLCPRQVLGVRMGMLAAHLLGLDFPQQDKRAFVIMETDGCGADGVSVATGCWIGRRTMLIRDFGKVSATFVDTQTERAFRIHPHPGVRRKAAELLPEARSRWHAQREAYQLLPAEDLLVSKPVVLRFDLKSHISRAGVRTACQICGEEIINEREVIHEGTVLCRACAGEAYYEPSPIAEVATLNP